MEGQQLVNGIVESSSDLCKSGCGENLNTFKWTDKDKWIQTFMDYRPFDVKLIVGEEKKEIDTNLCVLLAESPYFRRVISEQQLTLVVAPIHLENLNAEAVQSLISSVRTGSIEITLENVENILLAANIFQLDAVKQECLRKMMESLTPSRCFKYCNFASTHGFSELQRKAEEYQRRYFSVVCESEEFLKISHTDLIKLINNCDMTVTKYSAIFQAIKRWVELNESSRKQYVAELMRLVNLRQVLDESPDVLQAAFMDEEESVLKRNSECMTTFFKICAEKAIAYSRAGLEVKHCKHCNCCNNVGQTPKALTETDRLEVFTETSQRREGTATPTPGTPWVTYTMEPPNFAGSQGSIGSVEGSALNLLSRIPVQNPNVQPEELVFAVKSRPGPRSYKRKASVQKNGEVSMKTRRSSLAASGSTATITMSMPMTNSAGAAFFGQDLLYIRKYASRRGSTKVDLEAYNYSTKSTRRLFALNPARDSFLIIAHNNIVCLIGGTLDLISPKNEDVRKASDLVDMIILNAKLAVLQPVKATLTEARISFAGCVLGGYAYIVGGYDEDIATNTVERFNLNSTLVSQNKWENVDFLHSARGSHDMAVLDGKIYVVGGVGSSEHNGTAEDLKSVVRYDHNLDKWEDAPDMNERRGYVRVAVLNGKLYAVGGSKRVFNQTAGVNNRKAVNSVEVFDPVLSTWTKCPDMNHCRANGMVVARNNLLYAIAGNSSSNPSIEVFDPEQNTWTLLDWPEGLPKNADFSTATLF